MSSVLSDASHVVAVLKDVGFLAGLAGILATFFVWWMLSVIPGVLLVWKFLSFGNPYPVLSTLQAIGCKFFLVSRERFLQKMQIWVELQILDPKPEPEVRWEKVDRGGRTSYVVKSLEDDPKYLDRLDAWKRSFDAKFRELARGDSDFVITVRNVFKLNNEETKEAIRRYLLVADDLGIGPERTEFRCKVKIEDGYLAPLNLVAGLMSQFSNDWGKIIHAYEHGSWQSRYQASMFELWLLWGPSVPVCDCALWLGAISLQYGYGDENNSVRVRVEAGKKEGILREIRETNQATSRGAYPASHVSLVGRIRPPASFQPEEFCTAQQNLVDSTRWENFLIQYESHTAAGGDLNKFYTAYVWVMFVSSDSNGRLDLDRIKNCPWEYLFPFFEHAVIVDPETYSMAKRQLVGKVLRYLRETSADIATSEGGSGRLDLWYACALDDTGCKPPTTAEPRYTDDIRGELQAALEAPENADLAGRIHFDHPRVRDNYSSCHMNDLVTKYFNHLEQNYQEKH